MSTDNNTITVEVIGGPIITVPWTPGMNAQQALEAAYNQHSQQQFTYAMQYYGSSLGYLVLMINGTYDTFMSSSHPFFYWEFLLNGVPAATGIDSTMLHAGDTVGFLYELYRPAKHSGTTVQTKHELRTGSAGASSQP